MSPPRSTSQVAVFRRWLVRRLQDTCWVRVREELVESTAVRLGVQPSVLREAQAELDAAVVAAGKTPPSRSGQAAGRTPGQSHRCEVVLPDRVHQDWQAYCQSREVPSSTMLRSLVHRMLMSNRLPAQARDRQCHYRGRLVKATLQRNHGTGHFATSVECFISAGARQVLIARSRAARTTISALLRGTIIDLLEGRTTKVVLLHSINEMWNDPQRYATYELEEA